MINTNNRHYSLVRRAVGDQWIVLEIELLSACSSQVLFHTSHSTRRSSRHVQQGEGILLLPTLPVSIWSTIEKKKSSPNKKSGILFSFSFELYREKNVYTTRDTHVLAGYLFPPFSTHTFSSGRGAPPLHTSMYYHENGFSNCLQRELVHKISKETSLTPVETINGSH